MNPLKFFRTTTNLPYSGEGSVAPLLTSRTDDLEKERFDRPDPASRHPSTRSRRKRLSRRYWIPLVAVSGVFGVVAGVIVLTPVGASIPLRRPVLSSPSPTIEIGDILPAHNTPSAAVNMDTPPSPPSAEAADVDMLYARQSKTLAQAEARYALRTGRAPPRNYSWWYEFARERGCLIDEYDQIHRDFEPFYQLAKEDPAYFQRMVERASEKLRADPADIAVVEVKDGQAHIVENSGAAYAANWPITFSRFSHLLPDMTFIINGHDEPRVAFNSRTSDAAKKDGLNFSDPTPFKNGPPSTAEFFQQRSGCIVAKDPNGFKESANGDSAFLFASANLGFTMDLYPVLSMAKISPCFSDILFPTEYYYDQSWWSSKFAYPDNVTWDQKKPQTYWRGMSTGGMINGSNYHNFTRFRLADLGRVHPDILDVKVTRFAETLCEAGRGCDRAAVLAEYNITGASEPREDMYGFKYVVDVDGTTFSGRYLGLLRSGSLVFKATVFEEYFNDWLRPYEHYIPVRADLSDLVEKVRWANAHPAEARRIQLRGLHMAARVNDDQNDCYFSAVLLEWARLQEYAKGS
ncbi:glycosyl transferase family 90-domain-containing protein [Mycena sp. CBHHK59/15]|nr:glycosyl transferase family 90-domain-containing protein [Mycena sp. CBHHK59/15]